MAASGWAAARAAYAAGWSSAAIARAFHVSVSQVRRRARVELWPRPDQDDMRLAEQEAVRVARSALGDALIRASVALRDADAASADAQLRLAERLAKACAALIVLPGEGSGPAKPTARSKPNDGADDANGEEVSGEDLLAVLAERFAALGGS